MHFSIYTVAFTIAFLTHFSRCYGAPVEQTKVLAVPFANSTTTTSTTTKPATFVAPSPVSTALLGPIVNNPSKYFFTGLQWGPVPSLPANLNAQAISVAVPLATNYPIWNGTGAITLTTQNQNNLQLLDTVPLLSRDAGRGGNLAGTKMFIFSDTSSFTAPANKSVLSNHWNGIVANSAAFDIGFAAAQGQPPQIRDGIGEWANSNGGTRPWVPLTAGEQAYNNLIQPQGGRLAIWPNSGITLLTNTTAIQYAPIEVVVNGGFNFAGITMYEITVPNARTGPVANRVAPYLFPSSGFEWGATGGTRSWGAQGPGGSDGWVWAWANSGAGLWAARVPAQNAANLSAYQYYWASTGKWNSTAPTGNSNAADVTIPTYALATSDIFYSPRHKTFINIFGDRNIDNNIWWRYLNVSTPIVPSYDGSDFNLHMLNNTWSPGHLLYTCSSVGGYYYNYFPGIQEGYFDSNDITNGGSKMLITWTHPTGESAASSDTAYQLMSAVFTWN